MQNLAQRLRQLAVSDSGFVFDPLTGHTYSVNGAGLEILEGLKQGLAPSDLAARLSAMYEFDADDDPLRDIEEFIAQLRKNTNLG
ncbi:MAG: PqqD family protein [Polyangiaceae bacterium]|nr:PqqD family protein [Polyangiaceae bacterium]